jgi:voltage-gated sodium channel
MGRVVSLLISDRLVMAVIVLNTAALFLSEVYPRGSSAQMFWHWVDYGCVVFFMVEAGLKIGRLGWKSYWAGGWNRFDFVVVVLSLPSLLVPFAHELGVLANILVLRLGRIFRLFRVLRFIPNLDHLVLGIRRALRASVGVFLGLFLINFILAMMATLLFRDVDPVRFGNPLRSSYSIFQVFTVEGWNEIPEQLAEQASLRFDEGRIDNPHTISTVAKAFFLIAVIIGGILGLSLANAVFVDEMMMDNTKELEDRVDRLTDEIRRLRRELNGKG